MANLTRDGRGEFTRSPEVAERDAEAARLRSQSWTYQRIALHFGVTRQAAHLMVKRAMADTLTQPAEEAREFELTRLDDAEQLIVDALERKHFIVSHGKIVYKGETPLDDDGFVLSAVDRLVRISESRRKLLGLDAPQKIEASGGFTYELVGVNPDDV